MLLYLCRTINATSYLLDLPKLGDTVDDVPDLIFSQSGLFLYTMLFHVVGLIIVKGFQL